MEEIRKTLASGSRAAPGGPVILKKGLGVDKVYYLRENQSSFPGVTLERVFTREYKDGTTAAHLFGNVGEVTAQQLKEPRYVGPPSGRLGRAVGNRVRVRPLPPRPARHRPGPGRRPRPADRSSSASTPAQPGDDVRLTIDSGLQSYAEGALDSFGLPGAFVAMNAHDGADPRDGFGSELRPVDLHPPDHPEPVPGTSPRGRPTHLWRTGRSRASIRPARPSSRSPRRPPSRTT